MKVERFLFDRPSLLAFERVSDHSHQMIGSDLGSLSFNIAPSSKLDPTGLACGDGIVGWVVGQRDDGSAAFLAIKLNADLVI